MLSCRFKYLTVGLLLCNPLAARDAANLPCRPDPDGPAVNANDFVATQSSPYILPFAPGTPHVVWRTTSHFTPGNGGVGLYAIDFEMPIGTFILAARAAPPLTQIRCEFSSRHKDSVASSALGPNMPKRGSSNGSSAPAFTALSRG